MVRLTVESTGHSREQRYSRTRKKERERERKKRKKEWRQECTHQRVSEGEVTFYWRAGADKSKRSRMMVDTRQGERESNKKSTGEEKEKETSHKYTTSIKRAQKEGMWERSKSKMQRVRFMNEGRGQNHVGPRSVAKAEVSWHETRKGITTLTWSSHSDWVTLLVSCLLLSFFFPHVPWYERWKIQKWQSGQSMKK